MTGLVEIAGGRTATYEVVGQGRTTLMFPGGPGFAAAYMRADAELFADTLESFLIDPHGSRGSTSPIEASSYSPEGHAAFYDEVRRALGLDRVTILGHSFGATTALAYSALFPEKVDACVAVAPFGIGPDSGAAEAGAAGEEFERSLARHAGAAWYPEARRMMDEWTERVLATDDPVEVEWMMGTVLPLYTAHPDRMDVRAALEAMRASLTADLAAVKAWESGLYQTIDLRPQLGKITCPTLIIAGELDFICGPAQAEPIAQAITDVRLEVIPDCGHIPSVERPDEYRKRVIRFLDAETCLSPTGCVSR
jgi:proline iminopeptidase